MVIRTTTFFIGLILASVCFAETPAPRIAWYGQLNDGLAEAKRSGRPIFFLSAAPQCEGVPGMW